ncbi:MAG TPA: hypothetical protein PKC91_13050 [Ignavibacteria bacterium]|nr:hypothetical protein [Ignavibacteria bacterium]
MNNEQILLKDGVDIWVAPGRVIETSNSEPLIIDNVGGYTSAVNVSITGNGIFRNTNAKYGCIKMTNSGSKVSINCDSLENAADDNTSLEGSNIYIVNASKFHLMCDRISNANQRAIYFANEVGDININANIIENGNIEGGDTISLKGSGFLNVNEVICNNDGSCLNFKAGTLIANILKLTTIDAHLSTAGTVQLSGGTETQNLTLYFDEIQNLSTSGGDGVNASEGTLNLFGRRIFSATGMSMDLATNADILVDEIISEVNGINIHNGSTQKIIIDSNYIEGSNGNDGVIKSVNGSNYILRNAKVKNTYLSSPSIGIYIDTGSQTIEIENLIIVTGTETTDFSIFRNSTTNIDIKNLGLFVKKAISLHITLKIGTGTGTGENFKYIISNDIT